MKFDRKRIDTLVRDFEAHFNITSDQLKRISEIYCNAAAARDELRSYERNTDRLRERKIPQSLQIALWAMLGAHEWTRTPQLDATDVAPLFSTLARGERVVWCEFDARAMNHVSLARERIAAALKPFAIRKPRYALYVNAIDVDDVSVEATKSALDEIERCIGERTEYIYSLVIYQQRKRLSPVAGILLRS